MSHTSTAKLAIIWSSVAVGLLAVGAVTYHMTVSRPAAKLRSTAEVYQSQAQQILSSALAYRTSRLGWPATFTELTSGRFLKEVPVPPQLGPDGAPVTNPPKWEIVSPLTPYYWLHNQIPKEVCKEINLLVRGDNGISAAARPTVKIQCFGSTAPYTLLVSGGNRAGTLNMSAVIPQIDPLLSVDDNATLWAAAPSVLPQANMRSPLLATSLDFGTINIGNKQPKSVVFTNHSKQPVQVTGVYGLPEGITQQSQGQGICPAGTFSLNPKDSCTLSLVFEAQNDIPIEAEVSITSDYEGFRSVGFILTGRGIDPVGTVRTMNSGCVSPEPFGYDAGRRMMITYGMYAGDLYGRNGWATVAQGCPNDGEFAPYVELSSPFMHGPSKYAEGTNYPRFDCPRGFDPLSLNTKYAAYDASSDTIVYTVTCHKDTSPSGVDTPGLVQIRRGTAQASMMMSQLSTEVGHNWTPLAANNNEVVYYVAANADNNGLELRRLDKTGNNGYTVVFTQFNPSFMKELGVVDPRGNGRYVWFPVEEGHQLARVDTQYGTYTLVVMANMDHGTMHEMMSKSKSSAIDSEGILYTSGSSGTVITATDTNTGETTILAGTPEAATSAADGEGKSARFQEINGLRLTQDEKYLMVADKNGYKYTMRKIRIRN